MPLVFSYGTLQQEDVQLSTFGRLLEGQRDELPRFEPSLVKIEDPQVVAASGKTHHANVTFNGRDDSRVSGTVFEITDAEFAAADHYEQLAAYKRVAVTLASGKQAWVYVDARSDMSSPNTDKVFNGSIPKLYETYLVPLIFEPYAPDLVNRLASRSLTRVLEIAAGTGVVTRHLAAVLAERASIVATDLNQSMLDEASALGTRRPVEWRQADAMRLPFPDGMFDAVVCQFGVMFFPDKSKAFSEARRVLRPGGVFIFNVWDRIEENEFADTVTTALESLFPDDPPRFLARTPHGYYDRPTIERDLANGGFITSPQVITVASRSRAASAWVPAIAYCQGTPLRNEIEARDISRLGEATDIATEAIARRFGREAVDGKIQAYIVTIDS